MYDTNKKQHMRKDWREFEKLIARIESVLKPAGAVVRSPDSIQEVVSGRCREVDAAIHYQVGSVPILITVECRRRKHKEDCTWIEQLATKKENIGAAKTIAVSSTGFSKAAMDIARRKGIEIRRLDQITSEDIAEWLHDNVIRQHFQSITIKSVTYVIGAKASEDICLSPAADDLARREGAKAQILIHIQDGTTTCVDKLLDTIPNIFSGVIVNNPPLKKGLSILCEEWCVPTNYGIYRLKGIEVEIELVVESKHVAASQIYSYANPNEALVHGAEYNLGMDGATAIFSIHKNLKTGRIHFSQTKWKSDNPTLEVHSYIEMLVPIQSICEICKIPVTDVVRDYCLSQPDQFKGRVLCEQHQSQNRFPLLGS